MTGLPLRLTPVLEGIILKSLREKQLQLRESAAMPSSLRVFKATLERELNISSADSAAMACTFGRADLQQMTLHPGWQSWLTIGAELICALLVSQQNPAMIPPASIGISAKLTIENTRDSQPSARRESGGAESQPTSEPGRRPSTPAPTTSTPNQRDTTNRAPGGGSSSSSSSLRRRSSPERLSNLEGSMISVTLLPISSRGGGCRFRSTRARSWNCGELRNDRPTSI